MNVKTRRKLLNGLAIAAPAVWIKPVISIAVIPAHASASPCRVTAFEADDSGDGEINNVELELSPIDPNFNGTAELQFQTEFEGGLVFNVGSLEIEDGAVSGVSHEVEFESSDTGGGQELDVTVLIDQTGAICFAETVTVLE